MTIPTEVWTAVLPIIETLESFSADYYISGSIASSYTGAARATQDADLVADLRPAHGLLLVTKLADRYYVSEERVQTAIRRRKSFNLIHLATAFKIDIFVLPDTSFAKAAMTRRTALDIPELGRSVDICSAEDIVLHKLQWYELGNRTSDRQWNDLQGVLRLRSDDLDTEHLQHWARELGLRDLLELALSEALPGENEP